MNYQYLVFLYYGLLMKHSLYITKYLAKNPKKDLKKTLYMQKRQEQDSQKRKRNRCDFSTLLIYNKKTSLMQERLSYDLCIIT